jgi:hypothetical protein
MRNRIDDLIEKAAVPEFIFPRGGVSRKTHRHPHRSGGTIDTASPERVHSPELTIRRAGKPQPRPTINRFQWMPDCH